jgi:HlyD family secretion protein
MRRWSIIILSIVLALAAIGGAGYLGLQGAQGQGTPGVQAPTTVDVTRGDVQQTVTAPGQLVGTHQVSLSLDVSGDLVEVDAQPGQQVQAGDMLARIDPAPLQDKVTAAQANLDTALAQLAQLQAGPSEAETVAAQLAVAQAQANLDELQTGPTDAQVAAAEADVAAAQKDLASLKAKPDPDNVAQARAELERAQAALQQAQAAYDRVKDHADVGMLPQALDLQNATIAYQAAQSALDAVNRPATVDEIEAVRARLASAQAALAQLQAGPSADDLQLAELQQAKAEADLAQLTAGPPAAELQQARAAVQSAQIALDQAQADLAAATLAAPFDGVLLEVDAQPGERIAAGVQLAMLADPRALEVEGSVVEEDLPLVQVGQEVELFFDAWPDAETEGRVSRVVPKRMSGDVPLYPVYITVEGLPDKLLVGMTVDASIVVDSRSDVLRLPRAIVHARTDGTATVQVWTSSRIEDRPIHTGLRGDVYVEILDGLQAGEQVVAQ